MGQVNTYITFNGDCREAMTFYQECLGGELMFQTVGDIPAEGQCPEGMKDQIMHSMLKKGDMIILATDMVGKDGFIKGNNICLSMNCASEEEINTFFKKLSSEGKIIEPITHRSWGALFGCLVDKYGINWMFNYPVTSK